MTEKPNEWVAVADLMSGALAAVALMLVVAITLNRQQPPPVKCVERGCPVCESPQCPEPKSTPQELKSPAEILLIEKLQEFLVEFSGNTTDPAIRVSVAELKIWLASEAFEQGSACLSKSAERSLNSWWVRFPANLLENQDQLKVTVEIGGYTDSIPVSAQVKDIKKKCASYNDNVGLSVARAIRARDELINKVPSSLIRNFVVAGYGDTRPLPNLVATDARNRRVEVRFVVTPVVGDG